MTTPYIGFGNDTLGNLPTLKNGDEIKCPKCKKTHFVKGGKDEQGQESDLVLFYKCGKESYLAGVGGRNVMKAQADVQGELEP